MPSVGTALAFSIGIHNFTFAIEQQQQRACVSPARRSHGSSRSCVYIYTDPTCRRRERRFCVRTLCMRCCIYPRGHSLSLSPRSFIYISSHSRRPRLYVREAIDNRGDETLLCMYVQALRKDSFHVYIYITLTRSRFIYLFMSFSRAPE